MPAHFKQTISNRLSIYLNNLVTWAANQDEILALYLYGSQAQGRAGVLSDIDIGILVKPELSKQEIRRWERKWVTQWPESIDIHILNLGPLPFQYEVTAQGRRLWTADANTVAGIESLIWRRYWDWQPIMEKHWRHYVRHLLEERDAVERKQYQAALEQVRTVHRRVREAAAKSIRDVQE